MEILSNAMLAALRFFAYFGGYGWGIVWLTVAVNFALYPLTLSSVKSMAAMQRLQPRLQEIQKKHKANASELQKQTMDAYKAEGVNPLGGCLPILIKIPFFLALFWLLQSNAFMALTSDPKNDASFLWISGEIPKSIIVQNNLSLKLEKASVVIKKENSQYIWNNNVDINGKKIKDILGGARPDNINDIKRVREELGKKIRGVSDDDVVVLLSAWNKTNDLAKPERIRFGGIEFSLFALLIGVTTYLMQKTMPGAVTQQTQMMNTLMPIFIAVISWNFPAGVQIYWLVSNLMGAVQQYYILNKPKKWGKKQANPTIVEKEEKQ